jgi:glycerol-3-phosphate acyltransferase PlsY
MITFLMVLSSLIAAYLIGSLPLDYWIAKKWTGVDIRTVGSKNPGATNLKRILKWKGFFAGFISDSIKGVTAVWLAYGLGFPLWQVTAIGALVILGHICPVFMGFKGGKGVSTFIGVGLMLNPVAAIIFLVVWAGFYIKTRFVSACSMIGAASFSFVQVLEKYSLVGRGLLITIFSITMLVVILITHRENIIRLLQEREVRS